MHVLGPILQAGATYVAWVILWQLMITVNIAFAPQMPLFVLLGVGMCTWLTRFVSERGVPGPASLTNDGPAIAFTLLAILLCISCFVLQAALMAVPPIRPLPAPDNVSPVFAVAFAVFGPVFAGVIEEIGFRGIIQRALVPRLGAAGAVAMATFLFAVWHIGSPLFPYQCAGYLVAGVALGLLLHLTRSLALCVLAHGAVNLIMNAYVVSAGSSPAQYSATSKFASTSVLLLSGVAMAFVGRLLWRKRAGTSDGP